MAAANTRTIDSTPALPFASRVLAVVSRIPPGRICTYGQVAALAGVPRAARAVGNIMRGCHRPGVPCHRVVAAGGRLGGYGGNVALKRELLRAEGVTVVGTKVRDAARHLWPRRAESRTKTTRSSRSR